jgi:hypothetical protein
MESLLCVMIDRSAKGFEIAPCTSALTTMPSIARAGLRIDLRQRLCAPVVVEAVDPGLNFELISGLADVG